MKSILDPSFRYTSSFNTSLRRTFARIRRDQQQDAESAALPMAGALAKLSLVGKKTANGRR
jgi:hypothetical protein